MMSLGEDDIDLKVEDESNEMQGVCCNPSRSLYRYIAFIFICLLCFGNYFVFDNPAALEDDIMTNLNITHSEYGLLYSIYSWPNTILPLVGGYLIDRVFGIRMSGIIFAAVVMIGQLVFATGAYVNVVGLMLLGRFIFAIGGENIAVAQNGYCVKWFKGNELNTVFGIQLSFARVGSTVNMYSMVPILKWMRTFMKSFRAIGATLFIGSLTTVFSLMCAIILSFLDRRNDRYKKMKGEGEFVREGEKISLSDFTKFPLTFWLLCMICVAYYAAIFPFVGFAQDFFVTKYGMTTLEADVLNSLVYLISIVGSPLFGIVVDVFGRNAFWMLLSTVFTLLAHCLLAFTSITPYIPVCILGVMYSLMASSLWTPVAFVVPERCIGTAYGIMQSIQNLGQAIVFIAGGKLVDIGGYPLLESFFICWLEICGAMIIALLVIDATHSGVVNMTAKARKIYLQEQKLIEQQLLIQ